MRAVDMSRIQLHLILALCISAASAATTCTKVITAYSTYTGSYTEITSTLPAITLKSYSSTVLIGTSYHGPKPFTDDDGNSKCRYYTGTKIPPSPTNDLAASDNGYGCATTTTTTTTVPVDYQCTYSFIVSPPPIIIPTTGTLTTKVPSFCAGSHYHVSDTNPNGNAGNLIRPIQYPYFAQTARECCIACSKQFYNLVASAFIKSGLDCQCLVNENNTYPGVSKFCPHGLEPYAFGGKGGSAFPGACRIHA